MAVSGKINWQKMNSIITVKGAKEDYLFSEQLKKIKSRCNEITENGYLKHETILGIEGERGSGKSSFLSTVGSELTDYFVMDIIDPSVFEDSMSIIELFISRIYKYVTDSECENFESTHQNLLVQLRDITKVLADFKAGKENFYRDNTYEEVLTSIKTRVNLRDHIDKLVADFLSYVNATAKSGKIYKAIVLCIDDTDLISNVKIFNLLEEVRKYLTGNVIVIAAYYSRQLFDAVFQQKLQENNKLLEVGAITKDQVRDQVARYLEKLIPVNNRISLFDAENILNKNYVSILSGIIEDSEKYTEKEKTDILNTYFINNSLPAVSKGDRSIKEWIYRALYRRLRIKLLPVDKREDTVYNLPLNLRGLLQLIMIISANMRTIKPIEDVAKANDYVDFSKNILTNLNIFDTYLYSKIMEVLPEKLSLIIDLWKKSEYDAKNYLICSELLKQIIKKDPTSSNLPKYNLFLPYNISIGDVYDVLETYKEVAGIDEKERFFVYSFKVLYSIELLKHYLNACVHYCNKPHFWNESLEIYLSIINAKIIPESFSYFTSNLDVLKKLEFNAKVVENETDDEADENNFDDLRKLYMNIFYTSISSNSMLRRSIPVYPTPNVRRIEVPRIRERTYNAYKYYRLYNFEIFGGFEDFVDTHQYPVDPLAFVGQAWYVNKTFFNNYYVFYSIFDIDALVRFNYGRGDTDIKNALSFLIRKIYCILTGKNKFNSIRLKQREIELREGMSAPIFYGERLLSERKCAYSFENSDEVAGIDLLYKEKNDLKSKVYNLKFKERYQRLLNDIIKMPTIDEETYNRLTEIDAHFKIKRSQVSQAEKDYFVEIIEKLNFDFDISKYE